jgi:hypothetical protein
VTTLTHRRARRPITLPLHLNFIQALALRSGLLHPIHRKRLRAGGKAWKEAQ